MESRTYRKMQKLPLEKQKHKKTKKKHLKNELIIIFLPPNKTRTADRERRRIVVGSYTNYSNNTKIGIYIYLYNGIYTYIY